ncbi:hypothetical protein HYV81_03955 [Candidatus Woesearchaeota archaeon]|nr:hypothetical protein [Candidatus Woesearchaeota archaeon]
MSREKILAFVRAQGPVIPSQIAKEVGTNILFASAMLSELVARKELKVSSVKIGGSPLYYIPGQEAQLEQYSGKLHEKERQAFEQLKEKRVLRDIQQAPVTRVALRSLKDFAVPLEVSFNNQTEIFWKWHTFNSQEAEQVIRSQLSQIPARQIQEKIEKAVHAPIGHTTEIAGTTATTQTLPTSASPVLAKASEERSGKQKRAGKRKSNINEAQGPFSAKVQKFFGENHAVVQSSEVKRNGESEGLIQLPTPFGDISYYYLAKNKKAITEKDISEALAKAQLHNTSIVIFSTGELNKKAQQMLQSFKTVHFKQL